MYAFSGILAIPFDAMIELQLVCGDERLKDGRSTCRLCLVFNMRYDRAAAARLCVWRFKLCA